MYPALLDARRNFHNKVDPEIIRREPFFRRVASDPSKKPTGLYCFLQNTLLQTPRHHRILQPKLLARKL
jgi:hypothetical protein